MLRAGPRDLNSKPRHRALLHTSLQHLTLLCEVPYTLFAAYGITIANKLRSKLTVSPGYNGHYLQDGRIADPYVETIKPYAHDPVEANKLWKLSEKLVGQEFAY